jgi:hypothetical protein
MTSIQWSDLRGALTDFRRTWPQLVLTDFLARTLAVVVVTPIVGLLLKLFLMTADDGVLADTDIAAFALHPIGLTAIVIVGAVSLGVWFAEQGVLMTIGFGVCIPARGPARAPGGKHHHAFAGHRRSFPRRGGRRLPPLAG